MSDTWRSEYEVGPSRPGSSPIGAIILVVALIVAVAGIFYVLGRQTSGDDSRSVTPRGELAAFEQTNIEIFNRVSPSVVHITTGQVVRVGRDRRRDVVRKGSGTGFCWDDDGHIVTNYHVIESAVTRNEVIHVRFAGDVRGFLATLVGKYPGKDLAVIKVEAPEEFFHPITLGTSHDLQVGQYVLAIGSPFRLDQTLTNGIVSSLGRAMRAANGQVIDDAIQTNAAINPGNSGGPLIDSAGRLVGVNTAILSETGQSSGIGFAIPVSVVRRFVPDLISHGRPLRPVLGVRILPSRREGVYVQWVHPKGPAAQAGLRGITENTEGGTAHGDIITHIDGRRVRNQLELFTELDRYEPGSTINLKFIRNGSEDGEVRIVLADPQDFR